MLKYSQPTLLLYSKNIQDSQYTGLKTTAHPKGDGRLSAKTFCQITYLGIELNHKSKSINEY